MNDNFLTKENFYLAFKRLQTAQRGFYKKLYFDDLRNFGRNLDINIETTINRISNNTYEPKNSYKIYIPKPNEVFTVI
jgi:hypothetical protein